jgi:hypothetical protein
MNEEIEELDEPTVEPEWCEHCSAMAEENDFDYEFNVTWSDGGWTCDDCGGVC